MNQTQATDKLSVLIMLTALFTLTGCDNTPPVPPSKVVERVPHIVEKPSDRFFIRDIKPDGKVQVGGKNTPLLHCLYAFSNRTDKPFHLEGKARVGDPVVFVWHLEDQVLENGQIRLVTMAIGVKSKYNQDYEQRLKVLKEGENPSGTN